MGNLADPLCQEVRISIERGLNFLLRHQGSQGQFVDFFLPPGWSDGWVTGFVTVAMDQARQVVDRGEYGTALARSADFLLRSIRSSGWGFNALTATDADSTAFAVRAVLRARRDLPKSCDELLRPYIDIQGHGHTFLADDRMGDWAAPHPDVTPSIALALHEAGGEPNLLSRLLGASLAARNPEGLWEGYWWREPCYPTWINLQWLRAAGALSPELTGTIRRSLKNAAGKLSLFDIASLLGGLNLLAEMDGEVVPRRAIAGFLQFQGPEGAWPPSLALILPPQFPRDNRSTWRATSPCYADARALLTTAGAIQMLAAWHLSCEPSTTCSYKEVQPIP